MRHVVPLACCALLIGCDPGCLPSALAGDAGESAQPEVDAYDLVTSARYRSLVVEIDAVDGAAPNEEVLDLFEERLLALAADGHLDKPAGISLVVDDVIEAPAGAGPVYTRERQHELSQQHRDLPAGEGEAFVHVLYLDGSSELDEGERRVLGYAYGGSYVAMFRENLEEACASSTLLATLAPSLQEEACETTEAGVLLHELGHLFGLVDNGLPMVTPHKDAEHGAHDVDEECLMYWLAETSDAVDVIAERYLAGRPGVPPFDERCLEDLDAAVVSSRSP